MGNSPEADAKSLPSILIRIKKCKQSDPFAVESRTMKILFLHQNFPGQFKHLAQALAAAPENRVVFITQRSQATLPGVEKIVYRPKRKAGAQTHLYLRDAETHVLNGQAVARVALNLKKSGFVPDVIVGHNGWGEIWYVKDIFPDTPLIGYFEFFYRASGADAGFDPQYPTTIDTGPRIRTKNVGNLIGLDCADFGICPTAWQKSVYPARYHSMLDVIHEGVDTALVAPNPNARLQMPGGVELCAGDEVVTYVARNLEPYRGFPSFMRSLPEVLRRRPRAHVVIVGGDETSYGAPLPGGKTYRQQLLQELGRDLDPTRVHFVGKVPYPVYLTVLQLSRVHVYLTYPFVLSWSMLEAMSAGCLVLGSKTAPVEEVIRDGGNGLLVDFFDVHGMSEKIIDALGAPDRFADIRKNARRTIMERYDLRNICLPAQIEFVRRTI
jgi:glycosyltransferase involved in cell wall biosynthesis